MSDDRYAEALRKQQEAFRLQRLFKGMDAMARQSKMERLKRWGQANCGHCGGPLETCFDQDGRNPLRFCWPCEERLDALQDSLHEAEEV